MVTVPGRDFDHRKEWIQARLEDLAGIFAVDLLGFSLMSNHIHLLLRNRPDLATDWSDEQVALRWWRLHPPRRNEDGLAIKADNWLDTVTSFGRWFHR